MSQLPPSSDSQQPSVNSSSQQRAEGGAMENDTKSVQGNNNRSVQGNGNQAVLGDSNTIIQADNSLILVINQDADPLAIAISFSQLVENNPGAKLQFVGVEPQGEDRFLLKAETTASVDKSHLRAEYFGTYNQVKDLSEQNLQLLLTEKNKYIVKLENTIRSILESPHYRSDVKVDNSHCSTFFENQPLKRILPSYPKQQQERLVGKKTFDDHKYNGKLVSIFIELYEKPLSQKVFPVLTIAFGNPEVKIPRLDEMRKTIDIKFGVKGGELCFSLRNGIMPLNQREQLKNQDYDWEGIPIGTSESPVWEFRCKKELRDENELKILFGIVKNQNLGIIELLESNICCEVEVAFKISVNRNYIVITDLDDKTNGKKQKETKIGLLLKFLESELENYVSKVTIKYDPTAIP